MNPINFNYQKMSPEIEAELLKTLNYVLKGKKIEVESNPELDCVGRYFNKKISYNPTMLEKAFQKRELTLLEIVLHEAIHAMQSLGRYLNAEEDKWDQEAFSNYGFGGRDLLDYTTSRWMLESGKDILSHYNLKYSISVRKEMEAWAYSRLVVNYLANPRVAYKDPIISFICDKLFLR